MAWSPNRVNISISRFLPSPSTRLRPSAPLIDRQTGFEAIQGLAGQDRDHCASLHMILQGLELRLRQRHTATGTGSPGQLQMDEDARTRPRLAIAWIVDQNPAAILRHAPHILAMHARADLGAQFNGVVGRR